MSLLKAMPVPAEDANIMKGMVLLVGRAPPEEQMGHVPTTGPSSPPQLTGPPREGLLGLVCFNGTITLLPRVGPFGITSAAGY